MATALRPVRHEDRLSIVEHLDELRNRLIISIVFFGVVFAVAAWQNHRILDVINRPLEKTAHTSTKGSGKGALEQTAEFARLQRVQLQASAALFRQLARPGSGLSPAARRQAAATARANLAAARAAPTSVTRKPITLGVTEPFITTFT